ncbi:hypothetical protein CW684_11655 [Macrococcoides caseolyticum]|nr:hypothetical protein CW684_11655 [Macrococcus caseolyticus]
MCGKRSVVHVLTGYWKRVACGDPDTVRWSPRENPENLSNSSALTSGVHVLQQEHWTVVHVELLQPRTSRGTPHGSQERAGGSLPLYDGGSLFAGGLAHFFF